MFATTVDYCDDPRYAAQAKVIWPGAAGNPTLAQELQMVGRIVRAAGRERLLLLRSSWGRLNPDVLAAAIISRRPAARRPTIVLKGCMWQPDPGRRGAAVRRLIQQADKAIALYAVQSSEELTLFPKTWGVPAGKTRFCPYFYTFTNQDLTIPPPPIGNYVFSGGNSHRDYPPLLEAAAAFPDRPFIIATNRLTGRELPPNVTAKPVPHRQFVALMQGAAAVVIPLQGGLLRASGQQTYLNALWLGKPTIVADGFAVHDHIIHGQTALIADGTANGYINALAHLFDPANQAQVQKMTEQAKASVEKQFSFTNHVTHLLQVMAEAGGN